MDFKTVGDSVDLGEGAAEILRTTLMETGKYTVVERSMLKEALKEQKLGLSGVVDQDTAVGVGKLFGAKLVAVGSVVKMGESYTLNIRFVNVATGEVISGKKLTARTKEDIPGLCGQLVEMLSNGEAPQKAEEDKPLLSPKPPPVVENIPVVAKVSDYKRKRKVHGIGLMGGSISTDEHQGLGFGIQYDFVGLSGLGFQMNLAWYNIERIPSLNSEYFTNPDSSYYRAEYFMPVILKYHFNYFSDFSPYIGLGAYYNRTRYYHWDSRDGPWIREDEKGVSSLLNLGFELFAKRPVHLALDMKYFVGKKTSKFNSNAVAISGSLSGNW